MKTKPVREKVSPVGTRVLEYYKKNPHASNTEVANALGLHEGTVTNCRKNLIRKGHNPFPKLLNPDFFGDDLTSQKEIGTHVMNRDMEWGFAMRQLGYTEKEINKIIKRINQNYY